MQNILADLRIIEYSTIGFDDSILSTSFFHHCSEFVSEKQTQNMRT